MKFVALAVALLLAVGCQAASLQADAPSQLAHIKAAIDVYANQVKDSFKNALNSLDDTEHQELKQRLSQRVDEFHAQLKALQGSVSPITDSVVSTLADATADFRASLTKDIETLKADLEPKRAKLREVINEHLQEYRIQLEPIVKKYYDKHTADMEALKVRLEPVVEELRAKVATNVEETKAALMPILEAIRTKVHARLENLKELVSPYVEEYKDQLKQAYSQVRSIDSQEVNARSIDSQEVNALREKIAPLVEDIKVKLHEIFEAVAATVTKS
uniref:Apolipoprotein A-1 n=1 Tax=Channa striata TaxID=64152 RepID=A0A077H3P6_CHASR|nr:apolipoprotein A-1 [Channa striata]